MNTVTQRPMLALNRLSLALGLAGMLYTAAGYAAPVSLSQPAQPLAKALQQLAISSGVTISASSQVLAGKTAPALQGSFEVDAAIEQLIEGSGLVLKQQGNVYIVEPVSGKKSAQSLSQATQETATLQTISVKASKDAENRQPDNIVQRQSRGTALFGNADLREVPFTVNVITDVEIDNKMAKTLGEVLSGDPAVRNDYGGSGGYPTESFNIRGFQIAGGSAFLKDGMPMTGQVNQGTENVEQVEVVRGPMGFRYGFLPPGGAINLVSKKPTSKPYHSLTLTGDEYGSAKLHLDVGDRVGENDQFGYRINTVYEANKNFVKPITKDRNLLSTAFDYRVTDATTLALNYDRNDYRSGPDIFHYTVPDVNGHEIKGIKPDGFWGQKWMPDNTFLTQTASFNIESQLTDKLKLSSTSGLYEAHRDNAISIAANAQPNGDFNMSTSFGEYKHRVWSNTTYLNLDLETGAVEHQLSAGAAYSKDVFKIRNQRGGLLGKNLVDANGNPVLDAKGAPIFVPFVNNFYHPKQFPNTIASVNTPYKKTDNEIKTGFFVSDLIRWQDWHILLAARHSILENKGIYSPGKNSSTDPTVGVTYDITPAFSVYGSYATGLEAGGRSPETSKYPNTQLDPQKSSQEEIGAKIDLNGKDLTLDTAIFRIEKAAEFVNGQNVYVQSGQQIHSGAEVRLQGKVTPELTVNTGLQYLHAELSGDPSTAGQRPMNVPKINATFTGDYKLPFVAGLTLTTGLYYTGEREINTPNVPAKAAAYTRWDIGARYETSLYNQDVIGRLNIENVTNKAYYSSGWYSLYEYGAPRTVSASVQVKF